jgi:hypothetical protein
MGVIAQQNGFNVEMISKSFSSGPEERLTLKYVTDQVCHFVSLCLGEKFLKSKKWQSAIICPFLYYMHI